MLTKILTSALILTSIWAWGAEPAGRVWTNSKHQPVNLKQLAQDFETVRIQCRSTRDYAFNGKPLKCLKDRWTEIPSAFLSAVQIDELELSKHPVTIGGVVYRSNIEAVQLSSASKESTSSAPEAQQSQVKQTCAVVGSARTLSVAADSPVASILAAFEAEWGVQTLPYMSASQGAPESGGSAGFLGNFIYKGPAAEITGRNLDSALFQLNQILSLSQQSSFDAKSALPAPLILKRATRACSRDLQMQDLDSSLSCVKPSYVVIPKELNGKYEEACYSSSENSRFTLSTCTASKGNQNQFSIDTALSRDDLAAQFQRVWDTIVDASPGQKLPRYSQQIRPAITELPSSSQGAAVNDGRGKINTFQIYLPILSVCNNEMARKLKKVLIDTIGETQVIVTMFTRQVNVIENRDRGIGFIYVPGSSGRVLIGSSSGNSVADMLGKEIGAFFGSSIFNFGASFSKSTQKSFSEDTYTAMTLTGPHNVTFNVQSKEQILGNTYDGSRTTSTIPIFGSINADSLNKANIVIRNGDDIGGKKTFRLEIIGENGMQLETTPTNAVGPGGNPTLMTDRKSFSGNKFYLNEGGFYLVGQIALKRDNHEETKAISKLMSTQAKTMTVYLVFAQVRRMSEQDEITADSFTSLEKAYNVKGIGDLTYAIEKARACIAHGSCPQTEKAQGRRP